MTKKVPEKQIYRGNCLKRGSWTGCRFKGGLDEKEGGGVFEGGLIPQCTLCTIRHGRVIKKCRVYQKHSDSSKL